MYHSLLSVFLFGMTSGMHVSADQLAIAQLTIAPPSAQEISIEDDLSASGVVVMDRHSGNILFAKEANIQRPMASITKLMTALLIVEKGGLDKIVTVRKGIENVGGNTIGLASGDRFAVRSLLSALLITSANDAAVVLAEYHSGSVSAFADAMNERAAQLGLHDTSYANPTGFDHQNQYSTPRDIAWLMQHVLQEPEIAKRMEKRWARITSMAGKQIALNHTHALLHDSEMPVASGKTGTTSKAGECLVSLVESSDRQYITVLLQSDGRYADMEVLLDVLVEEGAEVVAAR